MRAPRRRRPLVRKINPPQGVDFNQLSERVSYVGSPEHKNAPSFAGQPKPRADASICPLELNENKGLVQVWLEVALKNAQCGEYFEGDFPRYVWHRVAGRAYEARLVNREQGHYKGYPLADDECPEGLL